MFLSIFTAIFVNPEGVTGDRVDQSLKAKKKKSKMIH